MGADLKKNVHAFSKTNYIFGQLKKNRGQLSNFGNTRQSNK